jgi:hypothetical protein
MSHQPHDIQPSTNTLADDRANKASPVDDQSPNVASAWLLQDRTNQGDAASERPDSEEDERLTTRAVAAAAQLDEYQFWFPFIEEERPTADGLLSFMLSPGVLEVALNAIVLPSTTGKATPVTIALTPGKVRLGLERDGLAVETDLPLTDFANLPRNGAGLAVVNAVLRRLLAAHGGRERMHETKSATLEFHRSPDDTAHGQLTFKFRGALIPLAAETIDVAPALSTLIDQQLYLPSTARALARGLRHVSAYPKQNYFGPIVIGDGSVRAFSCDAVIEYAHPDLAGVELTVPVEYAADLASLLQRAKRGIRISARETYTAFCDDILRYRVPKTLERQPRYAEMKTEALSAPPIELWRQKLVPWLVLLDVATVIKGLPTTVRLLVQEENAGRRLFFTVDRSVGQSKVFGGPVPRHYAAGDIGQLPMKLLIKMTGSAEFETMELRTGCRAGALIQKGDAATLTCIFPFRQALDE